MLAYEDKYTMCSQLEILLIPYKSRIFLNQSNVPRFKIISGDIALQIVTYIEFKIF